MRLVLISCFLLKIIMLQEKESYEKRKQEVPPVERTSVKKVLNMGKLFWTFFNCHNKKITLVQQEIPRQVMAIFRHTVFPEMKEKTTGIGDLSLELSHQMMAQDTQIHEREYFYNPVYAKMWLAEKKKRYPEVPNPQKIIGVRGRHLESKIFLKKEEITLFNQRFAIWKRITNV